MSFYVYKESSDKMTSVRSLRSLTLSLFIILTLSLSLLLASCGEEHKHEWGEWEPYIESTCYVAGQERSLCSCGAAKYRRVALSHEFELAGTDISGRTMTMVCAKCGAEEERELTAEGAHITLVTVGDGTLTVERGSETFTAPYENYQTDSYKFTLNEGAASLADGAGEYSKYVLAPGYLGETSSYGAASEDLYGNVVLSRNRTDPLSSAVNGGAGAGYPVAAYKGEEYLGICTLSPVIEGTLLGMTAGDQAALLAEQYSEQTALRAAIETSAEESGFRVLCTAEGFGNEAAVQSFNDMITFIGENDWNAFRDGLAAHVDIDRAIDEMLFTCATGAADCVSANILWITYDGTTWIPAPYKLDDSLVNAAIEPDHDCNLLWEKLNLYFNEEIVARWRDLRFGPLSLDSVEQTVRAHFGRVPEEALRLDEDLASKVAESIEPAVAAVMENVNANLARLDVYFGLQ